MIPRITLHCETPDWQRLMAEAITDPAELLAILDLDRALLPAARRAAELFPLRVPQPYLARIQKGRPDDPLLRQVLPLEAECLETLGFIADPVGDLAASTDNGIIHKYHGRALIITTGACAVHCRYCFRRHFPYASASSRSQWPAQIQWLNRHTQINEVILSGGDPLSLSDARLADMASDLAAIPHLRCLRLHTRLPVVLPQRVDEPLLAWLSALPMPRKIMVIHANHAQELDANVAESLARLSAIGVRLYNQAVLLKGVNDDVRVLSELSERLMDIGVQPYYLHLLDRVQGAAHFEVPESQAKVLLEELANQLPGYLMPRLVREVPGAGAKQTVL